MANENLRGSRYEYVKITEAPDSLGDGFWTDPVSLALKKNRQADKMYFSVREAGATESVDASVITPIVQFRATGDERWQDFNYNAGTAFVVGDRIIIEDLGPNLEWRAGVKEDGYTSGSIIFGFDW